MRKAACTIYFRLRVLMNVVFYGIKISFSYQDLEPHDIIRVLFFVLLIITKVTVNRNQVISTVFYILCFVMIICLFLFQFSSRAAMFNKFELSCVSDFSLDDSLLFRYNFWFFLYCIDWIGLGWIVLHCVVLYCIVLYCIDFCLSYCLSFWLSVE